MLFAKKSSYKALIYSLFNEIWLGPGPTIPKVLSQLSARYDQLQNNREAVFYFSNLDTSKEVDEKST